MLVAVTNADPCLTPLGLTSECVNLYTCAPLFSAYTEFPLPIPVSEFIVKCLCGFNANGPKVCCGPLPSNLTIWNPEDSIHETDSYPESQKTCGKDTGGNRIWTDKVGKTALDEYPWMALLGYRYSSLAVIKYECGGSLINRRYVLTAAHCLVGKLVQTYGTLITVRLGEYNTSSEVDCTDDECAPLPQEIPVQAFYPHVDFYDDRVNRENDIGLVKLSKRAEYTDFVQPICLVNKKNSNYPTGAVVLVAGWGTTIERKKSPVKLKVKLPIANQSTCFQDYSRAFKLQLTPKQLCIGGEANRDACRGDSGGPVMKLTPDNSWEAIGIVSFGVKCGLQGWPAVYTSVVSYLDWIHSTLIQTNV